MTRAAYNHRLRHRVAQESQLLAEERWIIANLKKIKKMRNCLQIERLQLESWKTKPTTIPTVTPEANPTAPAESSSMLPRSLRNSILFEEPLVSQETACNDEELDLAVTSSVLSQPQNNNSMEEYDEDEEEDYDNYEIDMNMFMNGVPKSEKKSGKDLK